MSKDISEYIFAANGGYHAYCPSILFHNAHNFENWGIFSDVPHFWLGNVQSHDMFRPIVHERKYLMDYKHDYVITMLLLVTCWSTQPSFVLLRFSAGLTPKIANKNIQWRTVPWTISLYELCSVWVKNTVQELLGFFASPIQRGFQTSWKHLEMFPPGSQGSCKTWKVMEFYKFSGHGMSWKSTTFREWTGKKVQCWKTDRQVRKPVNSSKQVP